MVAQDGCRIYFASKIPRDQTIRTFDQNLCVCGHTSPTNFVLNFC